MLQIDTLIQHTKIHNLQFYFPSYFLPEDLFLLIRRILHIIPGIDGDIKKCYLDSDNAAIISRLISCQKIYSCWFVIIQWFKLKFIRIQSVPIANTNAQIISELKKAVQDIINEINIDLYKHDVMTLRKWKEEAKTKQFEPYELEPVPKEVIHSFIRWIGTKSLHNHNPYLSETWYTILGTIENQFPNRQLREFKFFCKH